MVKSFVCLILLCSASLAQAEEYLGQLSANPYTPNSTSGVSANNNRIEQAMENEYATDGPELYDSEGNFRGNLNGNQYDPDSVSNPYGRYGSEYSSDSINNPYGAGSEYKSDSPNNPYGSGWSIIDE